MRMLTVVANCGDSEARVIEFDCALPALVSKYVRTLHLQK